MNGVESKVSPEVVSQAVSSLDKYIRNHYGRLTRRTLRERQITVVEDLRDTLRGGQTEGYITLPTGVGKTVLFTEVTEAFNEERALETMIVVPTKILVDQTAERFTQFAPDLDLGKLYTFAHDVTRPVTITTYASLVRHIQDGTLDPSLYKLLVLDEVHRSLSGKRSHVVAQFTNAIKLGFTATPIYSEDRNVANLLNTEIHKMTIREAVEENLLSPFSVIIAETEVDLSNVSIKGNGDYDEKELDEAINIQSRNQAAVDLYQKLFEGQTAIAYCNSVKHAQDVAKLFSENGISAGFISGYQDKKEQAEILRRYHNGEIKVLCNADLLIEGFDEPRVSLCLNLRPTKSVVVAQQRAGRTLRLDPDNPNKHAFIVDFIDKTDDPRKLSVTFAEVAEAAQILVKKRRGEERSTLTSELSSTLGDNLNEESDFEFENIFGPENILYISGLKITVNSSEVMRIVREMNNRQYQSPPEGWMHMWNLTTYLKKSHHFLQKNVINYIHSHPEWAGRYLDSLGKPHEYYSPELVASLNLEVQQRTSKPEGWVSTIQLARLAGVRNHKETIERLTSPYLKEHPNWSAKYIDSRGHTRDYFSPELVELIKKKVVASETAPEGWSTANALENLWAINHGSLRSRADKYQEENPKWFHKYKDKRGQIREFYSPELIKQVKMDLGIPYS